MTFCTIANTVGNKNTNPANNEFDFNSGSLPKEKENLVDMDACMGFNIPTNNWAATAPPAFNDSPNIVPDDQSSVKEESKQAKTVIVNPFFGQKRQGSSNSTEALVDI